tara:strand:+ start:237 stop:503 length:267 start_codon:yes stop_codon:yes gene_type:complete
MTPSLQKPHRQGSTSADLTILDRLLEEHAPHWTEAEAEDIMKLYLAESADMARNPETTRALVQQFGVCLELVKCRARMQHRSTVAPSS